MTKKLPLSKKSVGKKNEELVEFLRNSERNLPSRPFKDIPPHIVEGLAMQGFTQEMIAATIGISLDSLKYHMESKPEYKIAYEKGKALGLGQLVMKGYEIAMDGDKDMIKFFLKTKAGFVESSRLEVTGKDGEDIKVRHISAEKNVMDKLFGKAYQEAIEAEFKEVKED